MANGDWSIFIESVYVGLELGWGVALIGTFETNECLKRLNRGWSNRVNLTIPTPAVDPRIGKSLGRSCCSRISFVVATNRLVGQFWNFDSSDLRGGIGKVVSDEGGSNPDRLEKLAAVIACQHADSHFGHDLEQSFVDRLSVGRDDLAGVEIGKGPFRLPACRQFPD